MKIAVSLLAFRPGRIGGTETYLQQLVAWMPRVARGAQVVAILDRDVAGALPTPGWQRVVVARSARAVVAERLLEACTPWHARHVERALVELAPDVVFFPQGSMFPLRTPAPAVVAVADVQHLVHPENFGLLDRTFRRLAYPRSLARARHVIAVSEFTRGTLVARCGLSPEKVTTVPHGFEPWTAHAAPAEPPVEGTYLYYPAATYPHKAHDTLLRSYATLRRRGDLQERLVFTGERTSTWWRRHLPLVDALGVRGDVVHLGFVSAADVRRAYLGASAVVFPSRYEGFGLPVLEAAHLGRRVITSRLPVFDEIGVPRHRQIDFADPEALLAALRDPSPVALERPALTWERCAALTVEVLAATARAT